MLYPLKSGETLTLRPAGFSDAASLVKHLKVCGGETDYLLHGAEGIPGLTAETECIYLDKFRENPRNEMLTGWIGNKLAAVGSVSACAAARISHNAEVGLAVKREFWGLGIGRILLLSLEDFAKSAGLKNLTAEVRADNLACLHLCFSLGYLETGRMKNWFSMGGEYFDEVLIQKCL